MTNEEQIAICKAIAKSCMWGQGGIGHVILDKIEEVLPMPRSWHEVHSDNRKQAEYEAVGIVADEDELRRWLNRGYQLCNYSPGELSLFNPPPMNGLAKYIVGELADRYGKIYDPHNYGVYERRAGR